MFKKWIATLLAACLCLAGGAAFAQEYNEENAVGLIKSLGIMNGYPDGSFGLENNVTRAEFTKIAVAASSYRNSVATSMTVSPFPDVPYSHWAAPYIKLAVTNKLITGYADATFRPDNAVTYEEALTIALKLLGYTSEDFGSSWPYGQIGLAENLGLTKNITLGVGGVMTRGDVVRLLFNTLNTKSKGGNSYYIETLNYQVVEDVILVATAREDSSVGSGKVYTSAGTYKIDDSFSYDDIGKKGDLILKNSDEVVMFNPSAQNVEAYSVYQVLAGDIMVYSGGQMQALDIDTSVTTYNKSEKTTLKNVMSELATGDVIEVYRNVSGVVDYAFLSFDKMVGPVTVGAGGWQTALGVTDDSSMTLLRNGQKVTSSAIETYDILYYSKELATVWAYSTKVTGIYESASPNKDSLTSVTVSGVSYEIESAAAMNALSSTGSYQYGDTVTLLLGRDGKVADVMSKTTNETFYGYLIGTGKKDYTNANGDPYNAYYIKVVLPSGEAYEYTAKQNYENYINQVVRVTFEDGVAKVAYYQSSTDVSGKISASSRKLGEKQFAKDAKILDVNSTDSTTGGQYTSVFLQRLDGISLSSRDILYIGMNDDKQITELILNNITGDTFQYGIVISAPKLSENSVGGSYTLDVAGTTQTISSNATYSVSSGSPAKFNLNGNKINGMTRLVKLEGTVKSLTETTLQIKGGNTYKLSDSVLVYKKTGYNQYLIIPLSEVVGSDKYTITPYYDKEETYGGRIRVLIAAET